MNTAVGFCTQLRIPYSVIQSYTFMYVPKSEIVGP